MKEVRSWIDKARTSLESAPNKKRPIRDQVLLREKMVSDVAIQKSKLSISVEKLQVRTFCIKYNSLSPLCVLLGMKSICSKVVFGVSYNILQSESGWLVYSSRLPRLIKPDLEYSKTPASE